MGLVSRTLGWMALLASTGAGAAHALTLSSAAFKSGQPIPAIHPCEKANVSPPLVWSDAPKGTRSFALLVEDPDAPGGIFAHWILYEIAPDVHELPQGVPPTETGAGGGKQGENDFRRMGYGGPCPPPGAPHRYVFRLYALNDVIGLAPGGTRTDLLAAIPGHVLAEATLVGTFARSAPGGTAPARK